MRRKQVQ